MHLRYIFIQTFVNDNWYSSVFNYQVEFIHYCLSKRVRKLNFETDGTFKAINIRFEANPVSSEPFLETMVLETINCVMNFDFKRYDKLSDRDKSIYVIDVVKEALKRVANVKMIPLKELLTYCDELIADGLVYRWKFRGMRLPEYKLKLAFNCALGSRDFVMDITVYKYGEKEPLCQGPVIRTLPDSMFFSRISPNILVEDDKIIITNKDYFVEKLIYLNISDLYRGLVIPRLGEPKDPNDMSERRLLWMSQRKICYDNDEFKIGDTDWTEGDRIMRNLYGDIYN